MDYLNREVFPSLKANREKLNEIFLQVADNAPSANPLSYYFSTNTAAADPTSGRIRLDNATQNAATTIRLSELNSRLTSAVAWLDVMQGSITTPIGVVTLSDAINPGRFVRFNLNTMTDNGAYWDLGVTPVESSHVNPFTEGEAVVVSFIAGVASGGATVASTAIGAYIRAVSASPFAASQTGSITNATGSLMSSGTLFLPLLNTLFNAQVSSANVAWRLSGNSLLGAARVGVIVGTSTINAQAFQFIDSNGLSWSATGSIVAGSGIIPQITANYAAPRGVAAGASTVTNGTVVFSNANNVTFGLNGSTLTASATVASTADPQIGLLSHVAGQSVSSVTRLAFQNASNVTFSLSTAVNAATLFASVAAAAGGAAISAAGSSQSAGTIVFSNSNGVSFGMNGSTVTASVGGAAAGSISAGTTSVALGQVVFSNSNNMSFGLNGSTVTGQPFLNVTGANGSSVNATVLAFTTGVNNVGFAVSTNASGATVRAAASISFGAGGATSLLSAWNYGNSNGFSFGQNNSTLTVSANHVRNILGGVSGVIGTSALSFGDSNNVSFGLDTTGASMRITASAAQQSWLASHIGGNSASVTRLAFSNASNVTFSLSTAAGAATLLASVDAGGGGGVAIAASGSTVSDNTVVFSNGTAVTAGAASASVNNVVFDINGSSVRATAMMRVTANITTTGGFQISKINFVNGNGVTFGVATSNDAEGRGVEVTASVGGGVTHWRNWNTGGNGVADIINSNSSFLVFPIDIHGPFKGRMTLGTLDFLVRGAVGTGTQNTVSWGLTMRGGLYTLANSTQLSLINSFSSGISSTTINSTASALRNNSWQGGRYYTVHSSMWSSQPVLSDGVQYWMGFVFSTANTINAVSAWSIQRVLGAGNDFFGTAGVTQSTAVACGIAPLFGFLATGTPPSTIGSAQIITSATAQAFLLPMMQFRNGVSG
jgi:hypothetical protein